MLVTLLGIVTLVRAAQSKKALVPMLVTLAPMMTLVRRVLPWNAWFVMLVTGKPFVTLGIVTFPPPTQPVMTIWLLLVM